jgi:hypothetical protein
MIKIKHGAINFQAPVTLTPFEGEPDEVTVTYKFLPMSQAKALAEKKSVVEFLGELIEDIQGLEVPYSTETLAELLDWNPAMGMELMTGFWRGASEARAKN